MRRYARRYRRTEYARDYVGKQPPAASPEAVKWARWTYPDAEWNGYCLWSAEPLEGFTFSEQRDAYYMRRDTLQKLYDALKWRQHQQSRALDRQAEARREERRRAVERKIARSKAAKKAYRTRMSNGGFTQAMDSEVEEVAASTGLEPETVFEFVREFGYTQGLAYLAEHAEELRSAQACA